MTTRTHSLLPFPGGHQFAGALEGGVGHLLAADEGGDLRGLLFLVEVRGEFIFRPP